MSTLEIFNALKAALAAIPLDAETDPEGAKLFESVELAANRNLGKQLSELLVQKNRACLIVPLNIRRTITDQSGGLSVMGEKYAEVALIYSDKAYFKASQAVTFGGANNLGLFVFDEMIEAALTGKAISPFGGIVPGDSDPLTLSDSEQKDTAGRAAWLMTIFVPVGLITVAVA
jgi:hypothetical protein